MSKTMSTNKEHNSPPVKVTFRDPGMYNREIELENIRGLSAALKQNGECYCAAQVKWRDQEFLFWQELGKREWHGTPSQNSVVESVYF